MTIDPTTDVLIIIDVQVDFCPGGALAVADGNTIVPLINRFARQFTHKVLTQDWHPAGHLSFASSHPGKTAFDTITMPYGEQTLWPDHCIQGSLGAQFHTDLDVPDSQLILRKGFRSHIDSYSAFFENDQLTSTGLTGYLRERGLKRVFLCGLATDYCVAYSAIDARRQGFESSVFLNLSKAIDTNGSLSQATASMQDAGVRLLYTLGF
jgi:nicotinamidase/pyrazinamidase